ncbi:MAG: MarR family winged helix-turn-helix transcriptional regulator [Nocardioidaceae bacterium]|jgi:DNA-binding MarR family transcriptional regulator|nr:MarR family transcriptional regulator [Nocardioidaceae bacterium]
MTKNTMTEAADAFITASRALVGMAIRSIDSVAGDVTIAQHRVLVVLAARGPQTVGDIAAELAVNPSNGTRHCDRLYRLGLVNKQRSRSDGRIVEVSLTRAGKQLLDAVTEQRRREVSTVLGQMDATLVDATIEALARFNRAAREVEDQDWVATPW